VVRKAFIGDKSFRLPKGKIEPYRLWFEFLKLAYKMQSVDVDSEIYAPWGDIACQKFDSWWEEHWRKLFALKAETAVLASSGEISAALEDPVFVVLRVSLAGTKKRRMKDIEDALAGIKINQSDRRNSKSESAFNLSTKRSMNFKTLRGMLRYLELYLSADSNVDEASLAYYRWSRNWNDKVRAKKLKRALVYEPSFLSRLVQEINDAKVAKPRGLTKLKNTGEYNELRSQARRFLRKAEKIVQNVAAGKFPGRF